MLVRGYGVRFGYFLILRLLDRSYLSNFIFEFFLRSYMFVYKISEYIKLFKRIIGKKKYDLGIYYICFVKSGED